MRSAALCVLLLGLSPVAVSAALEVVPVADGVYAALQPAAQRFNDSNSAIIVTDRDVIVVDSQASPADVKLLIARIRELTDLPVRFVVNTHWHTDHTQGNQAYREAFPEVEFIAHHSVTQDAIERAAAQRGDEIERYDAAIERAEGRLRRGVDEDGETMDEAARTALAEGIDRARAHVAELRGITDTPPTLTYAGEAVLRRASGDVHLISLRAHTRGDTVIHLPRQKVLITGDMLDAIPYGGHGYPESWLAALGRLEPLSFDTIIPGHGPLFRGKDQLQLLSELLRSVRRQVGEGVTRGDSLEQVRAAVDLSGFRERLAGEDPVAQRNFDGFMPALIERAFLEARGELD